MMRLRRSLLFLYIAALLIDCCGPAIAAHYRVDAAISLDDDLGENWGTLFEITDRFGQPIAGAGYLGAYNTYSRSDRSLLHLFVRTHDASSGWQIERLPRVESSATGFYPFQLAGELYVSPRNGSDSQIRRWDASRNSWQVDNSTTAADDLIAGAMLQTSADQVKWNGRVILTAESPSRFGEHYFANGKLVVRVHRADGSEPANLFRVYAWKPGDMNGAQLQSDLTLILPQPREFVYAFGQWHDHILAVTNMGGIYRLRSAGWDTLRSPVPSVSFQIYSALNYRDKLLLGHYPTGELYEYTGDQLVLKKGWPPAMPGVSRNAREAQTLAIYNGDLYVGVWPWGEIWRYDGRTWYFVERVFAHPSVTDAITHPYEMETKAADSVLNLWGQRVTGLVPYRGSLIITTSSKGGNAWEPKFAFLNFEQRRDYGAIYRARLPGQLSAYVPLAVTRKRFELTGEGNLLTVRVDGAEMGQIPIANEQLNNLADGALVWGVGVYGPCRFKIEDQSVSVWK